MAQARRVWCNRRLQTATLSTAGVFFVGIRLRMGPTAKQGTVACLLHVDCVWQRSLNANGEAWPGWQYVRLMGITRCMWTADPRKCPHMHRTPTSLCS